MCKHADFSVNLCVAVFVRTQMKTETRLTSVSAWQPLRSPKNNHNKPHEARSRIHVQQEGSTKPEEWEKQFRVKVLGLSAGPEQKEVTVE